MIYYINKVSLCFSSELYFKQGSITTPKQTQNKTSTGQLKQVIRDRNDTSFIHLSPDSKSKNGRGLIIVLKIRLGKLEVVIRINLGRKRSQLKNTVWWLLLLMLIIVLNLLQKLLIFPWFGLYPSLLKLHRRTMLMKLQYNIHIVIQSCKQIKHSLAYNNQTYPTVHIAVINFQHPPLKTCIKHGINPAL